MPKEFGSPFTYDVNASDISGIARYSVNDTINFQIDSSGVITNAKSLSVGIYWLMIRASDPYNNNCSLTIKITVYGDDNPNPGGDDDDDDDDDDDMGAIPLGNYYLIFVAIAIISLILIIRRKIIFYKR